MKFSPYWIVLGAYAGLMLVLWLMSVPPETALAYILALALIYGLAAGCGLLDTLKDYWTQLKATRCAALAMRTFRRFTGRGRWERRL
jgi:hypothetical protein